VYYWRSAQYEDNQVGWVEERNPTHLLPYHSPDKAAYEIGFKHEAVMGRGLTSTSTYDPYSEAQRRGQPTQQRRPGR
jgi:hypothetical protein